MTQEELPKEADIVVIGGGIAGCSVAYHLTQMGAKDVLLSSRINSLVERPGMLQAWWVV